jgi:C-terminal processing protease CtpA/Prc
LFGTTSAGASCRKTTYTLTDGLYRVVVPVKAYAGFLDRPIERRGLEPDVEVRCTASDLSRGRDTVAEAAAGWLRRTVRE